MSSGSLSSRYLVVFVEELDSHAMKSKVLVVGGGFAGRAAVQILDAHAKNLQVIHIDQKPFFEFTPSILRCIVQPAHHEQIIVDHYETKSRKFILGRLRLINQSEAEVEAFVDDIIVLRSIHYDYCILATGSSYAQPFQISPRQNSIGARSSRYSELRGCREKCMACKR